MVGETGSTIRGWKESPKTQNQSIVQDTFSFYPLVVEPLYGIYYTRSQADPIPRSDEETCYSTLWNTFTFKRAEVYLFINGARQQNVQMHLDCSFKSGLAAHSFAR